MSRTSRTAASRLRATVAGVVAVLSTLALPMGPGPEAGALRGAGLAAQTMEEALNSLFVFSGGDDPLFLGGSAGFPDTEIHGQHFIPSESATNGALLGFFTTAIASNVSAFPLSATASGQTFSFVGGVPTPTSNSFGPLFLERAATLGRGRFDVGVNVSSVDFARIRGVPLNDVRLALVHQNVDFPNCSNIFGGECGDHGFPLFEHDVIELDLSLRIHARVYAFLASFGVLDWLDLGIAVPVVQLELDGHSTARVVTGDVAEPLHFFGGTQEAPVVDARSSVDERTSGIGDVALRGKARILDGEDMDLGVMAEVRFPTGREEDFLGSGSTSGSVLLLASGRFGAFSPHLNAGYLVRGAETISDAFRVATGFDQRLNDWATLALELLADIQVEDNPLEFPETAVLTAPFRRTVDLTNLPDRRDDRVDAIAGFKFRTQGGLVLLASAVVALNDGGMRARVIPTFGVQYNR